MIRQAIQENPSLLQPILSSLGASNPQLLQVNLKFIIMMIVHIRAFFQHDFFIQQISANPDAFLQLLNESEDESAGATMGSEDGEGPHPHGQQVIQVTAEESEAIARVSIIKNF